MNLNQTYTSVLLAVVTAAGCIVRPHGVGAQDAASTPGTHAFPSEEINDLTDAAAQKNHDLLSRATVLLNRSDLNITEEEELLAIIGALGQLKVSEAVSLLTEHLTYMPSKIVIVELKENVTGGSYVCAGALVRIGLPSLPVLAEVIATSDDGEKLRVARRTLCEIGLTATSFPCFGSRTEALRFARGYLELVRTSTKDEARAKRIQASIDAFNALIESCGRLPPAFPRQ